MQKLNESLLKEWDNKTFQPSTLIYTQNISQDLQYIYEFIRNTDETLKNINLENNPDIYVINNDIKNPIISVEQIRELKKWYYTTACFAEYKFSIIVKAESMNQNAANACLKFLEDSQKNKFTILLCENPYSIIKTLLSRCRIINSTTPFSDVALMQLYKEFIISIYSQDVELLSAKCSHNSTSDLAKCILIFFNRVIKYQLKVEQRLDIDELNAAKKLLNNPVADNMTQFKKVFNLISNSQTFDEKHTSCLLIEGIMG
jgi:hypothetical protein